MEQVARLGNWMQTASGIQYYPIDPRSDDVNEFDVAQSLSRICRYLGHCDKFYTVAEHSVLVSFCVPDYLALDGLMHDATEAYCCDIPRPLKQALKGYAEIEHASWMVIAERFSLLSTLPPEVKYADDSVLMAEREAIITPKRVWNVHAEPALVPIFCFGPKTSEALFLQRLHELSSGRFGKTSVRGWLALAAVKAGIALKQRSAA